MKCGVTHEAPCKQRNEGRGGIPWLYLKGVSTGDFREALQALVGPQLPA